jgi:hypothetical protein
VVVAGLASGAVIASGQMSSPRRSRPGLAALGALFALLLAACSYVETTPPAPTPADFGGIAIEFAKRGLHIDHIVAGDPGCTDTVLAPTAIAFDMDGLDQATPVRIYLYAFADRATFERLRSTIDACARSFVKDPETFESVEESPYVLASQGPWGTDFEATIRTALKIAAGTGDRLQAPP